MSFKEYLEKTELGLVKTLRPTQVEMHEGCLDILTNGGIGFIQAGTGTGKSFAYLLAALSALKEGSVKRLVVSTGKKTLQTQLAEKDVPVVTSLVHKTSFGIMKGKANYFCMLRLREFAEGDDILRFGDFPFEAFLGWAIGNTTGDMTEYRNDLPFNFLINVSECIRNQCPHLDGCSYLNYRGFAKQAKICITNHSLLAYDFLLGKGSVLGDYDALIIDEAHQFPELSRKAYSFEFYSRFAKQVQQLLETNFRFRFPVEFTETYEGLFSTLQGVEPGKLELTSRLRTTFTFLLTQAANVIRACGEDPDVAAVLNEETDFLIEAPDASTARKTVKAKKAVIQLRQLRTAILIILSEDPNYLVYTERKEFRDPSKLCVVPLNVAPYIGDSLRNINKVVLTSATLSTANGFEYMCNEHGVRKEEVRIQLALDSPFNFRTHSGLWVSKTAPFPDYANKSIVLSKQIEEIHELLTVSKGGAFVLCASREDMKGIAAGLIEKHPESYRVLVQGTNVDADIQRFKENYNSVLVGVKSIWEGVDIPGMKLRLLIVPRLPFPNRMDLLHNARKDWVRLALEEQGMEDAKINGFLFNAMDVQKVAIELIQGTGRLLRTISDFGAVVFLDPRMHPGAKPYSNGLRKLLPYPSLGSKEDTLKILGIFANLAEKERQANVDRELAGD